MTDLRPTWDETWMAMAEAIGRRSRCDGRQIGAVIVSRDNTYVVVGYNGPPGGWPAADGSTCSGWCPRAISGERSTSYGNCVSVHAEANAIAKADHFAILGGTLYVTSAICWDCAKIVANSGVKRIVCNVDWQADAHRKPGETIDFLKACGLEVDIVGE